MSNKLYVRQDIGNGDPLVLLHGMFADGSQWHEIAKLLSDDFRVIVVDLLGHGKSPRPKNATYSDKEHVAALRSTLVSLRAIKNTTVVGYSMGGAVALAYSSTYPDSVEQLYLISTPYYLKPEEMVPVHYSSSLLITKLTLGLFRNVEKLMDKKSLANLITNYANKSKKFHAMIGANDNELDAKIVKKNLDTLVREFDFVGHLKKLKAPLTFYVGKKDVFVVQNQLDGLRQYQPNMDIQRLDIIKVDHMLVQNLPNEMARLIRRNKEKLLYVGFDKGKGETIIFLNGIESSSDYWQPILPAFRNGRRAIAIDLLGFGDSLKPLNVAYSLDDQVAFLSRTVEKLGLKKFTIVGHSLGALVALSYAAENAKRIKSLVLFSPVLVPKTGTGKLLLKRIRFVEKLSDDSFIYSRTFRALGYKRMAQYIPLIRSVKNGVQKLDASKSLRAISKIPTTILYGERDILVDKENLQNVTKKLKNVDVIELKKAGHNFPFFDPKTTVENLEGYRLKSDPVRPAGKIPKTFLQQLAHLAAPILIAKSVLFIGIGLLLITDLAPWIVTLGLCFFVFKIGYSNIRGAFSLKNEKLAYLGYVFLGIAGMLLSFFLVERPDLALKISNIVICGLIIFSGLSKLLVSLLWTRQKTLRRALFLKGLFMVIIGLSALTGSIVSTKLIVIIFAIAAIARGIQFGLYATSALTLAYIRGFNSNKK